MRINFARATSLILVLATVLAMGVSLPQEASAASGYYVNYNDIAIVEKDAAVPIMEGMAVGSTYIYTAQINDSDTKAIINKTNIKTGETVVLKDSSTGSTRLNYLNHANGMCLKSYNGKTNLFVATMSKDNHGLVRLEVDGDKITKKGNYALNLNGTVTQMSAVEIMYASSTHIHFLFKRGNTFFRGTMPINATSGAIELSYAFSVDMTNVVVNGQTVNLTSYYQQGFGYHNGNVYFPVTQGSRSYILVVNTRNAHGTVKNDPTLSVRITSKVYAPLFEIEDCDIGHDGKLYFNTNRAGKGTNGVHYVRDYKYSGQSQLNVSASDREQLKNLMFDATVYGELNPDVKRVYGSGAADLKRHYLEHGIKEGRFASPIFDAKYYLQNNPDLAEKYGSTNYQAAYDHFIRTGFWEARQGSQYFHVETYMAKSRDLCNAFGALNYLEAVKHYMDCGINEIHRDTSSAFSAQAYYNRYSDLRKALGKNGRNLIIHYHRHGKSEGRKCV